MEKKMDQAVKETLTQEQILRYISLVDRRLFIVMHSGIDWQPEYAQELEEIDKELSALRELVDAAHAARQTICHAAAEGASMEALPCAESESLEKTGDCLDCEYCEFCDGLREGEQPAPEADDKVLKAVANAYCGSCQYYLEHLDCDPDCDLDRRQLKEEVRQAYLNGGRTEYLYDIGGNEYYTTRDGVRHYTRVEG